MSDRVTLRDRIRAFLSPPAPVYFVPLEVEDRLERYVRAGWSLSLRHRPEDVRKYFKRWSLHLYQETKSSGCETIRCEHVVDADTITEAAHRLDALGVLASESVTAPAGRGEPNGEG